MAKNIELRPLEPRDVSYGTADLQYEIALAEGEKMKVGELLASQELIVCFIEPAREPTKHMLKDIAAFKTQFEKWGGNILFVTPSDKQTTEFNPAKWNLPKQSRFFVDEQSVWMNSILEANQQQFRDNYPLVFIINTKGEITFKTEGYRIGTGELIFKSLK